MRVATWNVNSLKARLPRVEAWLADVRPDVLCLQETKLTDAAFPALTFEALGYETAHHGEGRWNGVAILSRVGVEDVRAGFGATYADPDARLLWATCGGLRVASAYVPNGRSLDNDHYRYKLEWLEQLRAVTSEELDSFDELVLAGDFNIAPSDADVWDPASFEGATHVSEQERAALQSLCDLGLSDVFRCLQPEPGLYSWWDYRGGSFHKRQGMRIDLLLTSAATTSRAVFATVDRNARKGAQPSDHAPVVVDLRASR